MRPHACGNRRASSPKPTKAPTMKITLFTALPLALLLSACGPAPSDQAAPAVASAPPTAAPQIEVPATTLIHAQPAALSDCNAATVTVRWDVRKDRPGVSTVKIYTGSGKLFAHSGASGSLDTGPWVKPGSTFILKSGKDDSELERLIIGGPVCNS